MSFFGTHSTYNELSTFDVEVQCFYSELIRLIIKKERMQKTVLEDKQISFKTSFQKIAHLFRYGPCYTSAIANHLLQMIKRNPYIFQDALWKRRVNVCCFSFTAIFEVVAICKIFGMAQEMFWESSRKPLQISITVFGMNYKWRKIMSYVLEIFLQTNHIFHFSKLSLSICNIKVNPARSLKPPVIHALKISDIVTVIKYASEIRIHSVLEQLIWDVTVDMKSGSILFFLDTGLIKQHQLLSNAIHLSTGMQCVHGPHAIEPFTMTIDSIRKCVEVFELIFPKKLCLTSCIISSGFWMKSHPVKLTRLAQSLTTKETNSPLNSKREVVKKTKREWCDKILKSQKALEDYHRKVTRALHGKSGRNKQFEEDGYCFNLDNSMYKKHILFKTKTKDQRIFLDDRGDFTVS